MKTNADYEKMSVFEQIREGLRDGIAHARGELTLRTTVLPLPAPKLTSTRVLAIRRKAGMSQAVFASYLNVPKRTLQSWEQGVRTPKAGEARLLQIFAIAPKQMESLVIQASRSRSTARRRTHRRSSAA